jgi:NAD(P)-dependent dehydrogenase (short-subunit alcohol dehydrogenase family)
MTDITKIALVTGANRGIGLEISRQLAQLGLTVLLGSRDSTKGQQAQQLLHQEGLTNVVFQPLDVTNEASILQLERAIVTHYGRLDILVNNAGIFPDKMGSALESTVEMIRAAMETNLYGPFRLCQSFLPLMRKNNYGRIVNLSSGMGQLSEMNSGCPGYRTSKTALNALTRLLADELKGTNVLINSMCPGWVRTDMGGPGATREVREGADTAIWLATLPAGGPSGGFFRDRQMISW